jgi:hypothetical protein
MLTKAGYDSDYEESLGHGYTASMADADTLHGSQDHLIPASSAPASSITNIPNFVATLPTTEQQLIWSLRQLNLRGWADGDKSAFSMNKTEQGIVDLAFEISATDQMTDFERSVLAKVRAWESSILPPISLATPAQRTFINTIRDWRRSQKPAPFIKRLFRK